MVTMGSGAMTNSIHDIAEESQCIFIIGSNTTEQHPVIGLNIRKAVRDGAKLIVADPRRTDVANRADVYLPIEPGSNIALLNGLADGGLQAEVDLYDWTCDDPGFNALWARDRNDRQAQIVAELKTVQGKPVDIGGYYKADSEKCKAVMRPSPTLNAALKAARV